MTSVARYFDLVILHDVLLKDSVTTYIELRLLLGKGVEISFRKETVVARDVVSNFRSTDGQFIVHIDHLLVVFIKSISGVVAMGTKSASILSLEEGSLG